MFRLIFLNFCLVTTLAIGTVAQYSQTWPNILAAKEVSAAEKTKKKKRVKWKYLSTKDYRELLKKKPRNPEILYYAAKHFSKKRLNNESIATYNKLISISPGYKDARTGLAFAHAWNGDWDEAEKMFRAILRRKPNDPDALRGLGRVLGWKGEFEAGRKVFSTLITSHPKEIAGYIGAGTMEWWDHKYLDAVTIFEKGLVHFPNDFRLEKMIAKSFLLGKYNDEAIKAYEILHESYPNRTSVLLALGELYQRTGQYDKALDSYEKILKFRPTHAVALIKKREIKTRAAHVDYKLTEQEKHSKLEENDPTTYTLLGRGYGWENTLLLGGRMYRESLRDKPRSITRLNGLAGIYEEEHELDKAEKKYHQALLLSPQNQASKEGLNEVFAERAIRVSGRYELDYFSGGDERIIIGEPNTQKYRHKYIGDVDVPIYDWMDLQLRVFIAEYRSTDLTSAMKNYNFNQTGFGPRFNFRFFPWLKGSLRYMMNLIDDNSFPTFLAPVIGEDMFHQGYAVLQMDIAPITITPYYNRELFPHTMLGSSATVIRGYNDIGVAFGITGGDVLELIATPAYRAFDQSGRSGREMYNIAAKFRPWFLDGFEFGYEFFYGTFPDERINSFSSRLQIEPWEDILFDLTLTFDNDDKTTPIDTRGFQFNFFNSIKFTKRFFFVFDIMGRYEEGADEDEELTIFTYLTTKVGHIKKAGPGYRPPTLTRE